MANTKRFSMRLSELHKDMIQQGIEAYKEKTGVTLNKTQFINICIQLGWLHYRNNIEPQNIKL